MESKEKTQSKLVWDLTRMCFVLLIVTFIVPVVTGYSEDDPMFLSFAFAHTAIVFSTFVLSIIHLTKYKEKGLAITALVISSILVLAFVLGFLEGYLA